MDRDASRLKRLGPIESYVRPATGGGDDIVVLSAERARTTMDVYRLNTYSGKMKLLSYDRPGDVLGYLVDRNDIPRLARSRAVSTSTAASKDK